MCDNCPRIYYRWCRTVATNNSTVTLIPSFMKSRPIVLNWDNKRSLYISSAIRTPRGRHSAQLLIDGELYPCDSFSVNNYMFEVPIYTKDSNSDEDAFPPLRQTGFNLINRTKSKSQEEIYKPIKLSLSRDSGIQDMNSEEKTTTKPEKSNENILETNFACVDEILDRMGSPISFEKDINVSLNRSQSLGSSLNKLSDQRTSTPIHRSFERIVVMMPENFEDFGKKRYLKKSIEIERNLERSFTTVEKSVAVVTNDKEICRGSERITEFGPDSVDVESVSNVLTVELKDEESQTCEDFEEIKKMSEEDELSEEDFEKELSEENIEIVEDESVKDEFEPRETDLMNEEEEKNGKSSENVSTLDQSNEEIAIENDFKMAADNTVDESLLVIERLNISPVMAENENNQIEDEIEDDNMSNSSKKSLQIIQDRINAHEEHVRLLEDEISLLDESRDNLQHENEELLEKKLFIASQLGEDRVVLAKEVEDLKSQVEQQEKANNALEWEVQELRNRLDSNDPGEVMQLLEEMKVLRDELITLTSKNKDLYGEIVELREENTTLKKERVHETSKLRHTLSKNHGVNGRYDKKEGDSSSSDGTEYPEFPVEMLGKSSRSLGVQTCVSAIEKEEKRKRKTKRKVVKKDRRDKEMRDDSYSSGSSTDFLLEKADDVIRKSVEELLDVGCDSSKKHHKVIKFGHSAINIKRPSADVSISCRPIVKYSTPFIPKSIFDLSHGLPIKFIHPLTSRVMEGIVQSISNGKLDSIQVRLNDSLCREIKENSFSCENNEIISVPMRKIILAWR